MVLYSCMLIQRCMALYGCMAPGGRRDEASHMYGASYSEIQRNTAEFHTACHTALSRMPRQRRVAWMCPSRSTCCHGCWVSPNTFSDPVFAHRDAIRMCLSAPFGAIQQEHHTAYHTAVLLHTGITHRHASLLAPLGAGRVGGSWQTARGGGAGEDGAGGSIVRTRRRRLRRQHEHGRGRGRGLGRAP